MSTLSVEAVSMAMAAVVYAMFAAFAFVTASLAIVGFG